MSICRLKKRAEFLAVAAANNKLVTHGVIVQALPREDQTNLRVGFTVSKRVGNAVARNRARRRLRAAAAEIFKPHGDIQCDLVLIGRTNTLTRSWNDLRGDLGYALRKLQLVPKQPRA